MFMVMFGGKVRIQIRRGIVSVTGQRRVHEKGKKLSISLFGSPHCGIEQLRRWKEVFHFESL